MKLYYYIHTGHRYGLDRLRRGATLYKRLQQEGIEAEVLLNDYRATIVAKELGIAHSTAIDSMYNIATIADAGDGLIIDTPELTDEILKQMCSYFRVVVRFGDDGQKYNEKLISQLYEDENSVQMLLIDPKYFQSHEKEERELVFVGDADYEKSLLQIAQAFPNFDLLLGHYFFLDYEKELQPFFQQIIQEYEDIVKYETVWSKSLQSTLEAAASGAKVCYFGDDVLTFVTLLENLSIPTSKVDKTPINRALANKIDMQKLKKLSIELNYHIIFSKLNLSQFKFK